MNRVDFRSLSLVLPLQTPRLEEGERAAGNRTPRAPTPKADPSLPASSSAERPEAALRAAGRESWADDRRVVAIFWQNFGKVLFVFGCIGADLCK